MAKAVIFDYYNTLLRYKSVENNIEIWKILMEIIKLVEQDFSVTAKKLRTLYKEEYEKELRDCQNKRGIYAEISLERVWKAVLIKVGMEEDTAEKRAGKILMIYRACAEREKEIFPNVKSELLALKEQGIKLLLLSNAQTCFIEAEFPEEIREIFDVVLISQELGIKKPSPEVFQLAFEKLEAKPKDIVYVGDSAEDDMIPAGKLGCHCIMIAKRKKKDMVLSHVNWFNPYKKTGYTGLCDMIVALLNK